MSPEERSSRGELITKAFDLAIRYHQGQRYGYMPYSYHIRSVVKRVMDVQTFDFYRDYEVVIAAYLHDIVEDTEYTEEQLRADFPASVADAVMLLTKPKGYSDKDALAKAAYLDGICSNPIAKRVKIADAMCNMEESYKCDSLKRVRKYASVLAYLL